MYRDEMCSEDVMKAGMTIINREIRCSFKMDVRFAVDIGPRGESIVEVVSDVGWCLERYPGVRCYSRMGNGRVKVLECTWNFLIESLHCRKKIMAVTLAHRSYKVASFERIVSFFSVGLNFEYNLVLFYLIL